MIAFDTDVFTEILAGDPAYVQRAKAIPREEQSVPIVVIVVVEEIFRGRLNAIRLTEAGKSRLTPHAPLSAHSRRPRRHRRLAGGPPRDTSPTGRVECTPENIRCGHNWCSCTASGTDC
jgi:hypothetical protein